MEAEDVVELPNTCNFVSESDQDKDCDMSHEVDDVDAGGLLRNSESLGQSVDDAEIEEGQLLPENDVTPDDVGERLEVVETVEAEVAEFVALNAEGDSINVIECEEGQLIHNADLAGTVTENEGKGADMPFENGFVAEHEHSNNYPKTHADSTSGVKRLRASSDEQQPSVHVKYFGLSRESKRKLEELLREWSEWSARNSSSSHDRGEDEVSESGEDIYFPALDIGMGKTSAVSFWVENDTRKLQRKDFVPVEDESVPLYDRSFALGLMSADGSSNLEGGLELLDAPRCFNCGSYSHSLKECPKPRDNLAVNNSRKQLKSRRNQTATMRNVARYYQDSPGGKFEGLRPGVLDADTRRLLGLGELDPPPWLNRMREIGYPLGYLEPDDEELPSGITIFTDEEAKVETEDGEILEAEVADLPKKMTVKFPGINSPIPQIADERLWAERPSNTERHRNGDSGRANRSSESNNSRGRYRDQSNRDFRDEDPPSFDRASRYPSRYGDFDFSSSSRSSRENASSQRSPSHGRSLGDRDKSDPTESEDSLAYSLYSSFSYNSSRRFSELGNDSDVRRDDQRDSSRSRDRADRHRHRGGR